MLKRLHDWWNRPKLLAAQNAQLQTALKTATESINLYRQDLGAIEFYSDPRNRKLTRHREDILDECDSFLIAGAGPQMATVNLRENGLVPMVAKERLWELELALEDRGWQRQLAISQTEFSRYGLQQIILFSRLYFVKNPLIRRGVLVSSYYTFGRGVEITSDDEKTNEVIKEFLAANATEVGQAGLVEKDQALHTDGNLYFVFFRDAGKGTSKLRTIDATEMFDIITNPDDLSEPQYYYRKWQARTFNPVNGILGQEQREAYHPALGFEPDRDMINGIPVQKDAPVYHMKAGGLPKWLFGLSEVYGAIDWARAYKQFLEDWATLNRALARFAWTVETKGGQQAVEQFHKLLNSTLGMGGTAIESNPPPVTASTFVTGPGNKMEPMKTGGMTTSPEQGRRILLMVAAHFGLPETFFGDASTGSLATAVSLDRPTELKFLERQERWRYVLQVLIKYEIEGAMTASGGKLRESRGRRVVFAKPARSEAAAVIQEAAKPANSSDITVTVKFPSVLEHDIPQMISAIIQGATLGGFQLGGTMDMRTVATMIMAELGVEDPVAVVDAMYDTDYDPKNYADNGKADDVEGTQAPPAQPGAHLLTPSFGKESAQLRYAIDRLVEASKKQGRAA